MESKKLDKVVDIMNSGMKLAANISEPKNEKISKNYNKTDDSSNKATTGNQSVSVMLNSGRRKDPKPVEKHIHKFPESRPLTDQECNIAMKEIQMEYEFKKNEQAYNQKVCDREWQYRMENEKKNERKRKIRNIFLGILAAAGVGTVGYSLFADYRSQKDKGTVQTYLPKTTESNITTEGTVK